MSSAPNPSSAITSWVCPPKAGGAPGIVVGLAPKAMRLPTVCVLPVTGRSMSAT